MPEQVPVRLSDGVCLHVEATGPPRAPVTVVLLHGWTLDGRTWHRQVRALGDALGDSARIITYDARGHGRSGPTPLSSATLAQLGDDLSEVLAQAAPTGPVVLAGHSLGGMAIMEYAHRHRDAFAARAAGLVLVATTAEGHLHTGYGLPARITRLVRLAETTGSSMLARCGSWRPPAALLQVFHPALRWLLFGSVCEPADLRLTSSAIARAPFCSIGGFRPSIGAQHRLETLAALRELPVAALVGDRDRLTPPRCAESIVAALPGAELRVCAGAGHMLMLERADEVSAALTAAVRRALVARAAGPAAAGAGAGPSPSGGTCP